MGNHEEVMLAFLDGDTDGFDWLQFGGHSTLLSYGIQLAESGDVIDRLRDARRRLRLRSEEHTSELQSLMRISYAVFCLKKKTLSIPDDNAHRALKHRVYTNKLDDQ